LATKLKLFANWHDITSIVLHSLCPKSVVWLRRTPSENDLLNINMFLKNVFLDMLCNQGSFEHLPLRGSQWEDEIILQGGNFI